MLSRKHFCGVEEVFCLLVLRRTSHVFEHELYAWQWSQQVTKLISMILWYICRISSVPLPNLKYSLCLSRQKRCYLSTIWEENKNKIEISLCFITNLCWSTWRWNPSPFYHNCMKALRYFEKNNRVRKIKLNSVYTRKGSGFNNFMKHPKTCWR